MEEGQRVQSDFLKRGNSYKQKHTRKQNKNYSRLNKALSLFQEKTKCIRNQTNILQE